MKVKEESEKIRLKLSIQKTKIMASRPITSWQIDRETMETVTDLIFFGSKITADGDCSHEIKRHLLLGRKAMTNLDSILKSRDVTLPTKVHLVKVMVFPVVMYGCEGWTITKAECRRTDALVTHFLCKSCLKADWLDAALRQHRGCPADTERAGPEGRGFPERRRWALSHRWWQVRLGTVTITRAWNPGPEPPSYF